ncbi:MAG: beta-ketoacyl-ACP synthase III [Desulfocapsaceae bacterium]|nr:beta-ketoacyl-ACP synthase III [Desulfocapsaceae bacterium]
MKRIVISGSGVYTPPFAISNEELVSAFNAYVDKFNTEHAEEIAAGNCEALQESSAEFIEKASGIRSRYVLDREGLLDPDRLCPRLERRAPMEMSIQCEISVAAAREAMAAAGKEAADIDAVLISCSSLERPYPAIAVEVQQALGIDGFAYDMNIACSSATFGVQTAADSIFRGNARAVLVITPEICSGHMNFRDRDSHFIFGDVCTALLLEREDVCQRKDVFEVVDTKAKTVYSTNIYNGFGFLNRTMTDNVDSQSLLFRQEGRKVFKEVVPLAVDFIKKHLGEHNLQPRDMRRIWLHQANLNMNQLIAKKLLGEDYSVDVTPTILDTYANTAAAGSVICFHKYHDDMEEQDMGNLCSFGAGYSIGSVILRKIALR